MTLSLCAAAVNPAAAIVAVPVRNEARRLPALIASLGRQRLTADRLTVVLVLNNCTDASLEAAETAARQWPWLDVRIRSVTLRGEQAHVGNARRLAMEEGVRILRQRNLDLKAAALLATDADAILPPDWVGANLDALGQGAALVGGRIIGNQEEEALFPDAVLDRARSIGAYQHALARMETLVDPLFHDPWPRHSDHLGASLAINAAAYEDIGGLPPRPFREDLALTAAVRARGLPIRHCPKVTVTVSARLNGRAQGGMADALRAWHNDAEGGRPILVECPRRVETRFRRRRFLRDAYTRRDEPSALDRLLHGKRNASRLIETVSASASAGALVETMVPEEPDAAGTVPVWQALAQIRKRNNELADRHDPPSHTH